MAKRKSFTIKDDLVRALDDTVTAATSYSGILHVDVVPTNKIELDPENPRLLHLTLDDMFYGLSPEDPLFDTKTLEKKSLTSLAKTIKEHGILNPVVVYKNGSLYRLIAGERRVLASILAGNTSVQAKILDKQPDPLKLSLLQWMENNERKDLSLWERIRNFEKIATELAKASQLSELKELSNIELSRLTGISPSQTICYLSLLHASKELLDCIAENKIKNLDKASFIAKADQEFEKSLISACVKGATLQNLKTLLASLKAEKKLALPAIKAGRPISHINFGNTKNIHVAEVLIKTLVESKRFQHLSKAIEQIDWNNYQSVSKVFKTIIAEIEERGKVND